MAKKKGIQRDLTTKIGRLFTRYHKSMNPIKKNKNHHYPNHAPIHAPTKHLPMPQSKHLPMPPIKHLLAQPLFSAAPPKLAASVHWPVAPAPLAFAPPPASCAPPPAAPASVAPLPAKRPTSAGLNQSSGVVIVEG